MNTQEQLNEIKGSLTAPPVNNLSILTAYCDTDAEFMQGYLASLPKGCEICLVKTIKSNTESFEIGEVKEVDGNTFRYGTWHYVNPNNDYFPSFAQGFNYAKSLATRVWCLKLDLDERILIEQDELNLLNSGQIPLQIWGLKVPVASYAPPRQTNLLNVLADNLKDKTVLSDMNIKQRLESSVIQIDTEAQTWTKQLTRIFRNIPEIYFERRVHEIVTNCINKFHKEVGIFTPLIKHLGYYSQDIDKLKKKFIRNMDLINKELAENPLDAEMMSYQLNTLLAMRDLGFFVQQKITNNNDL